MSDKGELPSVGMEFIDTVYNENKVILAIAHYEDCVVYVSGKGNEKEFFGAYKGECKPLPPKVELINGKAYQFHYGNSERVGFYNVADDHFYDNKSFEGATSHINMCTNIVPLVPEVK